MKKFTVIVVVLLVMGLMGIFIQKWMQSNMEDNPDSILSEAKPVGGVIATYKKVPAYQNGAKVTQSHGKHYAKNSYYYGQKWQCVEYVKRFYHDALDHQMPSVWGHAKDFYDPEVKHGEINPARGLIQYQNGGNEAPKPDDLLVFRNGSLGHVAIVTKVTKNSIEVIQQNVHGHPTSVHSLFSKGGRWTVGKDNQPAGWLRLPSGIASENFLDRDFAVGSDD